MRIARIELRSQQKLPDQWGGSFDWLDVFVVGSDWGAMIEKAVDYANDIKGSTDYYVTSITSVASDEEGEGGVLLQA